MTNYDEDSRFRINLEKQKEDDDLWKVVCTHDWYKINHGGWRCWWCNEESTDPC